jgi:hypothetical protein
MKNYKYPTELLYYNEKNAFKTNRLEQIFNKFLKSDKLIIAEVKIYLPVEFSYILVKTTVDNEDKSIFLSGTFITVLTKPELLFVKEHGKILDVLSLAIYENNIIFKDFVDFFYNKRLQFGKEKNEAYKLFCKYILNNLYGKFGQRIEDYKITNIDTSNKFVSKNIKNEETGDNYKEIKLGNKTFEIRTTDEKSFDSFIAIASFVTAYARMYLIEMILKAKRENVYYVDTDCLIVNQKGYDILTDSNYVNEKELGKLKLEETSINSTFYRPKYYLFNEIEKCKGVKKSAKKISENDKELVIEQEQFTRFKTSLRKNEFNKQTVNTIIKTMSKEYDKGIINKDNTISPYVYDSNAIGDSNTKTKIKR